jgi:hypothetical protein
MKCWLAHDTRLQDVQVALAFGERVQVERRIEIGREGMRLCAAESARRDTNVSREGPRECGLRLEAAVERDVDERLAHLDQPPANLGEPALPDVGGRRLAGERAEEPVEVPRRAPALLGDYTEWQVLEQMCLDKVDGALNPLQRSAHGLRSYPVGWPVVLAALAILMGYLLA